MLHAIAIDDEPAALEVLQRYAAQVPFLELVHSFLNPTDALPCLQTERVDLIFLDIQMPALSGMSFAELIAPWRKPIVFTTAYADYALDGFRLNALDYLVKPIEFSRFLQSCNRAYSQYLSQKGEPTSIFVKDGYDWVRVNLNDVQYIHSDTNLVFIHEQNRQVSTRMTLSEMIRILPEESFVRVHKSYVVALQAISKLERHQVRVGSTAIPLASTYREMLEQRLLGK